MAASVLFIAGSVVLAFSQSVAELFSGRVLVGLGIGVAANVVPVYLGEISEDRYRGAIVTVNNLAITVGQLVSYFVDSAFANVDEGILLLCFLPKLYILFSACF